MENCDSCKADAKQVICPDCDMGMCLACNLKLHLSGINKDHRYNLICEECEENARDYFCVECDEGLCSSCEIKLHKKGTRVQHVRMPKQPEDNFKMLLNFIYLPGQISDNDLKLLVDGFQREHVDLQLRHTAVYFYGEMSTKLSELLATYSLSYKRMTNKIENDVLLDYFVHHFDKKVYLNTLLVLSKDKLHDDVREHFMNLYPSAKVLDLIQVEGLANHLVTKDVLAEESKSKSVSKDKRTAIGSNKYSYKSGSQKNGKNDSKDQVSELVGGSDNLNNLSVGVKKRSFQFREVEPLSLSGEQRELKPSNLALVRTKLSTIIDHPILEQLNSSGCSLSEYLTYYYGIKEWRHAPQSLKLIFGHKLKPASVPLYHIFNDLAFDGYLKREKSLQIQNILRKFGEDGRILVDYNQLLKDACDFLGDPETETRKLLLRMADLNLIIINSRQVTQSCILNQVSFKLDILTLEDLYWTTKSLVLDRVTATEEIVLARLREAFGLKIKPKILQQLLDKFIDVIKVQQEQKNGHLLQDGDALDLAVESRTNPYVKDSDSIVFTIKSINTEPEDAIDIDEDHPDWNKFKTFINELFDDDLLLFNNVSSTAETKKKDNFLDKPIYSTEGGVSTSNIILNNTGTEHQESMSKVNPSNSVTEASNIIPPLTKAISGGRYGLAQLIKNFGPSGLSSLSMGKLSRLVQKAVDQGFLKYHQSFLIKTEELKKATKKETENAVSFDKVKQKVDQVFDKIVECLIENKNYKPVAQLSEVLSRKLGFKFDHKDFGYSKLTHFIEENCKH